MMRKENKLRGSELVAGRGVKNGVAWARETVSEALPSPIGFNGTRLTHAFLED